jgi:hypothetical protein
VGRDRLFLCSCKEGQHRTSILQDASTNYPCKKSQVDEHHVEQLGERAVPCIHARVARSLFTTISTVSSCVHFSSDMKASQAVFLLSLTKELSIISVPSFSSNGRVFVRKAKKTSKLKCSSCSRRLDANQKCQHVKAAISFLNVTCTPEEVRSPV